MKLCKVSLLVRALYAKRSYYSVMYMKNVLIIYCFICNVQDERVALGTAALQRECERLQRELTLAHGRLGAANQSQEEMTRVSARSVAVSAFTQHGNT